MLSLMAWAVVVCALCLVKLAAALEACSDTIIGGGGHAATAGVHLGMDQFAGFSRTLNVMFSASSQRTATTST